MHLWRLDICLCVALSLHSSWTGCQLGHTVTLVVVTEIHHHWSISISQLQAQMFFIQTCLNFIWTASTARNGSRALNLSFPVISIQRWIRIDSAEYIEGLMIHCTWHVIELVELKLKVCFYWRSHHPTYSILGSAAVVTKGFSMCSAPSYSGCSCI